MVRILTYLLIGLLLVWVVWGFRLQSGGEDPGEADFTMGRLIVVVFVALVLALCFMPKKPEPPPKSQKPGEDTKPDVKSEEEEEE